MLVWLLAIILVGAFGAMGFAKGAIRMGVSALGVFLGLAFAGTLGALLRPLFPSLGTQNLVWLTILPPVVAFLLIWTVFIVIGLFAHRPAELHYKYKEDDLTRKTWEAMMKSFGLIIGLFTGVVLFLYVGKQIYRAGYLTTQTSNDTEPPTIGYLNKLRRDMQGSGWDNVFAAIDRTPPSYYQTADLLGLLYHNPLIHARAMSYPPFLNLAEQQEFMDIGADNDLQKLFQENGGFMPIVSHPKVQAVLKNDQITQDLLKTDLKDFRTYLESGNSPMYDEEKILGRWKVDANATVNYAKRTKQNISGAEIQAMKFYLGTALSDATLTAYTDNRYVVKVNAAAAATAAAAPAAAPAEDPSQAGGSPAARMDPTLAQRYGLGRGGRAATAPAPRPAVNVAAAAVTNAVPKVDFSAEGTWKRVGDKYELTSKGAGGEQSVEAAVTDKGRLMIPVPKAKFTLFFVRKI
jgi:hypothetical protein